MQNTDAGYCYCSLFSLSVCLWVSVCVSVCWSRSWILQKRLNRSRCRLRPRNHVLDRDTRGRNLANTIERLVFGGTVASDPSTRCSEHSANLSHCHSTSAEQRQTLGSLW